MVGRLEQQPARAGVFRGGSDLVKTVEMVRELGPARAFGKIRTIALIRLHSARFDRVLVPMDRTETYQTLSLAETTTVGANRIHTVDYEPTPPRVFERLLAELPIEPADFSFIDFGCGKGRLMLFAAEFGFRRVVGVEFAVEFARQARERIAAYQEQTGTLSEMVCHNMDAIDFTIPDGPCVIFLFNPFAEPVLEKVIANLEASLRAAPRPIFVIYYNPAYARHFEQSPLFQRRELSFGARLYLAALSPYSAALYESRA